MNRKSLRDARKEQLKKLRSRKYLLTREGRMAAQKAYGHKKIEKEKPDNKKIEKEKPDRVLVYVR